MEKTLQSMNLSSEDLDKILAKYNEIVSSKSELQKQLELSQNEVKTRDKQLKELSKIDIEELNSKLKTFADENKALVESHNAEIAKLKTDYAIEKALTGAGARNIKATRALLDLENMKLDDSGNLVGLDEQVQKLLADENSSFLFTPKETQPNIQGFVPLGSSTSIPVEKDISQMNYTELCNYYENQGGQQ